MEMQYKRTDSICPDPQSNLLRFVKANDIRGIRSVIEDGPQLKSVIYGHPYNKPILYIACQDESKFVNSNTIDCLIDLGCDLHFSDPSWMGKEALHFATLGQNPEILKRVIKNVHNIDVTSNRNTALHLLVKEGDSTDPNYLSCARQLIQANINVNLTDKNGKPAIFWAARKEQKELIQLLLQCPNIDLSYTDAKGRSVRELLMELGIDVDNVDNSNRLVASTDDFLHDCLKRNDETEFVAVADTMDTINDENYESTFLQFAAERNLTRAVELLLRKGVDPNRFTRQNQRTPLHIAASHGHHETFELLINHPSTNASDQVLQELLSKLDYESDDTNHTRCFRLLSNRMGNINVNAKDGNGNYPIHYAARYGGAEITSFLLQHKASLANRNRYGFLTIADMDYDTLKEHFDSCIEAQPYDKLDKEGMTISFDYATLLPTKEASTAGDDDEEKKAGLVSDRYLTPETDAVLYISKSSELKPLLKHPLLTSFLYMKWHRIRWIFYVNLAFYLAFCASLIAFIITDHFEPSKFCYALLTIMTLLLFCRELSQIIVAPKKYAQNFENYIEISLIVAVCTMLFEYAPTDKTKAQLSAIVFLLGAFEMLFLLGNHPALTTNIVMLRTVSKNFFKFFLFYSILIVAFAFCFNTLFRSADSPAINGTEAENDNIFDNPFAAVFKTVIMLTGEFEAGDMQFDRYPVTSHLIFLVFVVTIAVVLLNLLNGLAVSDTQEIKNEAELVGHIARAEYIAYAESMVFNSTIITRVYHVLFPCDNKSSSARKTSPLAKHICLFPHYLRNDRLVVFANQNGRIKCDDDTKVGKFCACASICLDKKSVRQAKALLREKKEAERRRKEKTESEQLQRNINAKLDLLLVSRR